MTKYGHEYEAQQVKAISIGKRDDVQTTWINDIRGSEHLQSVFRHRTQTNEQRRRPTERVPANFDEQWAEVPVVNVEVVVVNVDCLVPFELKFPVDLLSVENPCLFWAT